MKERNISALCVIGAGSLWGAMGLLVRRLNAAGLSSLDICFTRALTTFIFLALVLLFADRGAFRVRLRDLWIFLCNGLISMVSFNYCYFMTMSLTSLSVAAVLLYTAPVFVMLLSAVLFGEKLSRRKIAAAAVAFAGCSFVSGIVGGAGRLSAAGILYGLGAGLGYAMYSVFSRCAIMRGYGSATISLYTFLTAAIATFFIADRERCLAAVTQSLPSALVILLLILAVTLLPYLLYTRGMQGLDNGAASILASIEPVVATLLGTLVFKEKLGVWNLAGIALVLLSIVLINGGAGRSPAPKGPGCAEAK